MTQEAENHQDKDDEGKMAKPVQEGCALFGDVAEESAGENESLPPNQRTCKVPHKEPRVGHPSLAGDGRSHGAEARNELREEQSDRAAPRKVTLGLADTGGSFEGKPTEQLQNTVAKTTTEREPDGVRDEAGKQNRNNDIKMADAMCCTRGSPQ